MLVTVPVVLLLLDRWPLERAESLVELVREKLPLFGMSLVSVFMTVRSQALGECTEYIHDRISTLERL